MFFLNILTINCVSLYKLNKHTKHLRTAGIEPTAVILYELQSYALPQGKAPLKIYNNNNIKKIENIKYFEYKYSKLYKL